MFGGQYGPLEYVNLMPIRVARVLLSQARHFFQILHPSSSVQIMVLWLPYPYAGTGNQPRGRFRPETELNRYRQGPNGSATERDIIGT